MKQGARVLVLFLFLAWFALGEVAQAEGVAAAVPHGQPIPFKQEAEGLGGQSVRAIFALLVALGIGVGGIIAVRRYVPGLKMPLGQKQKRVRVVEVTRLTPRSILWVVEFDGDTLLLCQSEGKVAMLLHKSAGGGRSPGALNGGN